MKQFEVPAFYRSHIISKVKAQRKLADPRKKDFSPTELQLGKVTFVIARHFGFCYGVENAIEKSYKAIHENPTKQIFLFACCMQWREGEPNGAKYNLASTI